MKDRLKEKFDNYRHEPVAPPSGHEQRFKDKLLASESRGQTRRLSWKWYAAAAAAAVLIITIVVNGIQEENQNARDRGLADVSLRVGKLEFELSNQIAEREARIDRNDPDIQKHLYHLQRLEADYEKLEKELEVHFGDERIVAAMIENYKLRVKVLEQIVTHLKIRNRTRKPANPGTAS